MNPYDYLLGTSFVQGVTQSVDKLTIRLLSLFNVKKETIDRVNAAFVKKQADINKNDEELNKEFKGFQLFGIDIRTIVWIVLGFIGVSLLLRLLEFIKQRR